MYGLQKAARAVLETQGKITDLLSRPALLSVLRGTMKNSRLPTMQIKTRNVVYASENTGHFTKIHLNYIALDYSRNLILILLLSKITSHDPSSSPRRCHRRKLSMRLYGGDADGGGDGGGHDEVCRLVEEKSGSRPMRMLGVWESLVSMHELVVVSFVGA